MLDLLLKSLIQTGPIGIVLGIMIWDNIQMKKKLFEVIENNTEAITKLQEKIDVELRPEDVP